MERNKNISAGDETVIVGHVYVENDGNVEVIPFHVDFGSSTVSFAQVGRSSEEKMLSSDFLKVYKYAGQFSSLSESSATDKPAVAEAPVVKSSSK